MDPRHSSSIGDRRHFRVQVGHWRVQVPGRDNAEAIQEARKRLCDDMPRLWDVITTMSADRFQVEEVR